MAGENKNIGLEDPDRKKTMEEILKIGPEVAANHQKVQEALLKIQEAQKKISEGLDEKQAAIQEKKDLYEKLASKIVEEAPAAKSLEETKPNKVKRAAETESLRKKNQLAKSLQEEADLRKKGMGFKFDEEIIPPPPPPASELPIVVEKLKEDRAKEDELEIELHPVEEKKEFKIESKHKNLRTAEELTKFIDQIETQLAAEAKKGFKKLENISKVDEIKETETFTDRGVVYLPDHGEAIIVGDTHGEVQSIESILAKTKFLERSAKSEDVYLVLTGDYIDRGANQLENMEMVLNLKQTFGDKVVLMRGNHEEKGIFSRDGFYKNLAEKYPGREDEFREKFSNLFTNLPHVLITKKGYMAVHAGIPEEAKQIRDLTKDNFRISSDKYNAFFQQMFWNDPSDQVQRFELNLDRYDVNEILDPAERQQVLEMAKRDNTCKLYGKGAVEDFCQGTGIKKIFRGHQAIGYKEHFGGLVTTIFSAELQTENHATFATINLAKTPDQMDAYNIENVYQKNAGGFSQIPTAETGKALRFEKKEIEKTDIKTEEKQKVELSEEEKNKELALKNYQLVIGKGDEFLSNPDKITGDPQNPKAKEIFLNGIKNLVEAMKKKVTAIQEDRTKILTLPLNKDQEKLTIWLLEQIK